MNFMDYFNMLNKLNTELKMNLARDSNCILLYNGVYIPGFREKFRYKKLKGLK